jgi:hypothetical protein
MYVQTTRFDVASKLFVLENRYVGKVGRFFQPEKVTAQYIF